MENNLNLYQITKRRENLEEWLAEQGTGELTEQILADLDITEATKDRELKNIYYEMLESEDAAAAMQFRINNLIELKTAHDKRIASRKKILEYALKVFGNQQVDEFQLSLKKSKYTDVQLLQSNINALDWQFPVEKTSIESQLRNELKIPSGLLNIKIEIVPKKTEIKTLIESGKKVTGAEVKENLNLKVK